MVVNFHLLLHHYHLFFFFFFGNYEALIRDSLGNTFLELLFDLLSDHKG